VSVDDVSEAEYQRLLPLIASSPAKAQTRFIHGASVRFRVVTAVIALPLVAAIIVIKELMDGTPTLMVPVFFALMAFLVLRAWQGLKLGQVSIARANSVEEIYDANPGISQTERTSESVDHVVRMVLVKESAQRSSGRATA